jgi:hypothetical protein
LPEPSSNGAPTQLYQKGKTMRNSKSIGMCLALALLGWFGFSTPCVPGEPPQDKGKDKMAITVADWPMYNHDLAGWRCNPAEKTLSPANVGKLVEKWRFPAKDAKEIIGVVHATPTVVAGEVYFGTATFPAFYKLAPDGKLCWVYGNPVRKAVLPPMEGAPITGKLRDAASEGGIFASALVADGAVYSARRFRAAEYMSAAAIRCSPPVRLRVSFPRNIPEASSVSVCLARTRSISRRRATITRTSMFPTM